MYLICLLVRLFIQGTFYLIVSYCIIPYYLISCYLMLCSYLITYTYTYYMNIYIYIEMYTHSISIYRSTCSFFCGFEPIHWFNPFPVLVARQVDWSGSKILGGCGSTSNLQLWNCAAESWLQHAAMPRVDVRLAISSKESENGLSQKTVLFLSIFGRTLFFSNMANLNSTFFGRGIQLFLREGLLRANWHACGTLEVCKSCCCVPAIACITDESYKLQDRQRVSNVLWHPRG